MTRSKTRRFVLTIQLINDDDQVRRQEKGLPTFTNVKNMF